MENVLSPAEFLEENYGIIMERTALITYIDDVLKQPSLSYLMKEYAKHVILNTPNNDMEN